MSVNVKQNGQLTKVAGLYEATAPMGIADCYSTEERLVGCWTDGKPLYQRSFHYSGTADNADFQVTIATLDATIEMKHILNGGLYRGGSLFNPTIYAPSDIYFRYIYDPSDYTLGLRVGASLNTTIEATVTIQYTKTTDTAGSGTWTPNGDLAVHYSTNEQVIGTWIDGRTVYRKVVDLGTFPNATDKTVAHGISNFDMCLNISIFGKRTDGTNLLMPNVVTQSNNVSYQVGWGINTTNITISAGTDRSIYSGYAILEYIKASS